MIQLGQTTPGPHRPEGLLRLRSAAGKRGAEGAGRLSHADVRSIGAVAYRLLFAYSKAARMADKMFKC